MTILPHHPKGCTGARSLPKCNGKKDICQTGQASFATNIPRAHVRTPRNSVWSAGSTAGTIGYNYQLTTHGRTKSCSARSIVENPDPTSQSTQSGSIQHPQWNG